MELSDLPSSQTPNRKSLDRQDYSYREAMSRWKTAEDVSDWIAHHFEYDMERALRLADQNESRQRTDIYRPEELFYLKKGICVDLARFAFETIQSIDSSLGVKYLMIEFEPLKIGNSTLRRHWVVAYEKNGQLYVMADTKRPGHIGGPYADISQFIHEYENFRKRKILSSRLTDTYRKKLRKTMSGKAH